MELKKPSIELKNAFIRMAEDYRLAGEDRYQEAFDENFDFENYVKRLQENERGINLEDGYVPDSHFWLIEKGEILGVSRLRHKLTPTLKKLGGHIGYGVPPSKRKRGYATELLKLTLLEAKNIGIRNALITCKDWNKASARVIEKNGGVFDKKEVLDDGEVEYHYWIKIK